jgi:multimeric flavodoxin WrbA
MTSVFIVFHSMGGTTAKLAEAAFRGASEVAPTSMYRITGEEIHAGRFRQENLWEELDAADALLFGCPTYMGGPSSQFKAFADASGSRWGRQRWAGKVAAGFTIGSNANGDQGHTLIAFSLLAAQHGMIWCGLDLPGGSDPLGRNRMGTQLGVTARSEDGRVHEADLLSAHYLARRAATVAKRLSSCPVRPSPCWG